MVGACHYFAGLRLLTLVSCKEVMKVQLGTTEVRFFRLLLGMQVYNEEIGGSLQTVN
jgi:hypothetical protein